MLKWSRIIWLAGLASPALAAAQFVALGAPGSQLVSMSADGNVASGTISGGDASGGFRWRKGGEIELLRGAVSVHGLSPSGNTVAGSSFDQQQREVASYWDAKGRLHTLGTLPGGIARRGVWSKAFGVLDEPRIVGVANDARDHMMAVLWEKDGTPRALALPSAGAEARALGFGADGRLIYGGYRGDESGYRGLVWKGERNSVLVGSSGNPVGEVLGASRNAEVIVGAGDTKLNAAPYRWTSVGLESLTPPDGKMPSSTLPLAVSDDGRVVVGSSGVGGSRIAIVWFEDRRPVRLDELLASSSITIPAGWKLAAATSISGNGSRIGGWGQHDGYLDSFIVDLNGSRHTEQALRMSSRDVGQTEITRVYP